MRRPRIHLRHVIRQANRPTTGLSQPSPGFLCGESHRKVGLRTTNGSLKGIPNPAHVLDTLSCNRNWIRFEIEDLNRYPSRVIELFERLENRLEPHFPHSWPAFVRVRG